jgi:sugar phosphate isomerase/epimerase
MSNSQIAAQLYTVREFMKTPEDMRKSLKKIKDLGFEWVQISGIGPISHEEMRALLDETGLKVCATHIPYERMLNDIEDVIYQHKLWDCKNIGVGSMPQKYRGSAEGYIQFAKEASEIGKKFAAHGFRFVYHNHRFEFEKYNGRLGMDILAEESDREGFDFLLDTYWVQAGGADPIAWINKLKGRINVIHFKDMRIVNDQPLMAEVGEGNLNWPGIVEACRAANVAQIAIEQDDCYGKDPFESLDISRRNMLRMGIR